MKNITWNFVKIKLNKKQKKGEWKENVLTIREKNCVQTDKLHVKCNNNEYEKAKIWLSEENESERKDFKKCFKCLISSFKITISSVLSQIVEKIYLSFIQSIAYFRMCVCVGFCSYVHIPLV